MIDYYKILEIEPNSNEIQIRRAYLKLAKKYHPDINRNDNDAKLKFQMINMAYQFLIKKENRQKYNEKTNTQKEKEEEYLRRKYGVSKGRYNDIKKKQRATKNDTKEYEFKEPLSDNFYFTVMFIIGIIGIVLGIVNLFINEWDGIDSLSGLTFGLMFTAIIVFGWFKFNNKILKKYMQAVVENYLKYKELSAKFPNFIFNSYDFEIKNNGLDIQFEFIIEDLVVFNPKVQISYSNSLLNTDNNIIENLVFNIGMIELISYWKTTCSKNIIINNILINEKQIKWWKDLYYNGLGEFIYLNGLSEKCNIENLFNFQVRGNKTFNKFNYKHHNRTLVPIGGGKDSVVTTMMMKEAGRDIQFLIINPRKATIDTVITAKYTEDDIITINRQIDSKLLDLNSKGFLNGHTPFSAMLSFYSILVAYLYGYTDIALSNESSANEPTIPNTQINHQYSKSIDYENAFRTYCSQYISPDFNYYSFLRQLNELQIVQKFSKYPQFFDVFKSCNVGSKNDTWCCNCPKCLFTYIMLSAFIDDEQLINIFGENLLNKESMIEYYEQLAGIVYVKPFECVGTVEEVNIALNAAIKIRKNQKLPLILELYSKI